MIVHTNTVIALTTGSIVLLNLPFGYWRAGVKRFSLPWFLAVHLPVPLAVGLRFLVGLGLRLSTLPIFIAAFFTGQFLGGKLRKAKEKTDDGKGE